MMRTMRRWFAPLSLSFLLLCTFVVHRDSFLRRSIISAPSAPTNRIVSSVRTNGPVSIDDYVAIVARTAGVKIAIDHAALLEQPIHGPNECMFALSYVPTASMKIAIDLDDATVEQALSPVLRFIRYGDAVVIPADGGLLITTKDAARQKSPRIARTYDLRPVIGYNSRPASADEVVIKQAITSSPESVEIESFFYDLFPDARQPWITPTWTARAVGDQLLVIAPAVEQEAIAKLVSTIGVPRQAGWFPPKAPPGPALRRLHEPQPSLDLRDTQLNEALARISAATRLHLRTSWKDLEAIGVNATAPIDLNAAGMNGKQALDAVCKAVSTSFAPVSYGADGGMILVGVHNYSVLTEIRPEAYEAIDLLVRELRRFREMSALERSRFALQLCPNTPQPSLVQLAGASVIAAASEGIYNQYSPRITVYRGRLLVIDQLSVHEHVAQRLSVMRTTREPLVSPRPAVAAN
jgi:hypothetical protein